MKTYEGTMMIRWGKYARPSFRPITIECESHSGLIKEQKRIREQFLKYGEDNRVADVYRTQKYVGVPAYGVVFWMDEKK